MARLKAIDPEEATGKTKELFESVKSKMGMVPNMMRTMGNSPAALNGYLAFSAALNSASIGGKLGELISLSIANKNGCDYCNAAHSYVSEKIGLDADAINDARKGTSADPKVNAALVFAKDILNSRGHVTDEDLEKIKNAGYNEAEIIEIVAKVSLSIYTNYINVVAATDIDFPKLSPIN
jgi:uncharacterized peroxidase-related enzyme